MPSFFITGTDTGVGKTFFTCWLVRAWRAQGHDAAGLKPIATGDREDARLLEQANDFRPSLDEINPIHFQKPAAPLIAARAEIVPLISPPPIAKSKTCPPAFPTWPSKASEAGAFPWRPITMCATGRVNLAFLLSSSRAARWARSTTRFLPSIAFARRG